MALTYELHRGPEALRELRGEWEQLETATAAPYFQCWALAQAWTEILSHHVAGEPLVVVCRSAEKPVGIFPAARIRSRGLSLVTWLGIPHVQDSGDVLFDRSSPHVLADEFVEESVRILRDAARGAVLHLGHVREDAIAFPALSRLCWHHRRGVVPVARTEPDLQPYESCLSKQLRKSLRRQRNKMEREGGFRFEEVALDTEKGGELLRYLFDLKSAQRAQAGKTSDLLDEEALAFYRRQAQLGAQGRLSTLMFADKPVAGIFDIVQDVRRFSVLIAYDAEYARYSPGLVLDAHVLCDWLDSHDHAEYNFGWGDDAYKQHWRVTEIHLTTFVGKGPGGLAALSAMRLRDALAKARQRTR